MQDNHENKTKTSFIHFPIQTCKSLGKIGEVAQRKNSPTVVHRNTFNINNYIFSQLIDNR